MLAPMLSVLSTLNGPLVHALQLTLLFAGSLLLWWIWKFTLVPILKPNEPKELPHWIPCKQHAAEHPVAQSLLTVSSSRRSVLLAKVFSNMTASFKSSIPHQAAGHAIPFFKDSEATLRYARYVLL